MTFRNQHERRLKPYSNSARGLNIIEIQTNLFHMPAHYSLTHCVAEDFNMSSGIAVAFRHLFKRVDVLLNQQQRTGGLAILQDHDRYIYYLVTKPFSSSKPTYDTLYASLTKMRRHILQNNVTKIAMPRIGCGLDKLLWQDVRQMLERVFQNIYLEIIICNLVPTQDTPRLRHYSCRVTELPYPIDTIERNTILLFLTTTKGYISKEMEDLNVKFNFLHNFRYVPKRMGSGILFPYKNYLLFGCVVQEKTSDPIDFQSLQRCLIYLEKKNYFFYKFNYVAFQVINKYNDNCINEKITNILRNTLTNVEVCICRPKKHQH